MLKFVNLVVHATLMKEIFRDISSKYYHNVYVNNIIIMNVYSTGLFYIAKFV